MRIICVWEASGENPEYSLDPPCFAHKDKKMHLCECLSLFRKVREGLATAEEMEAISSAWRAWSNMENGLFYYVNGQAIATVDANR